ncbi:MAG: hypothetical protein ACLQCU_05080 [Acidimicrobiales bacterium]
MVLVVVVAIAISLLLPVGRHQWAESLIRQPSPYTTLAFEDPSGLPAVLVAGHPISFTFWVGNHELRDATYRYLVTSSPSKKVFYAGGTLTVPMGRSRSVKVSDDPECSGSPCQISVVLVDYAEKIAFNVRLTGIAANEGRLG